ncbi:unnamed protein product, partial [Discosporangium mesarthrocarpum]
QTHVDTQEVEAEATTLAITQGLARAIDVAKASLLALKGKEPEAEVPGEEGNKEKGTSQQGPESARPAGNSREVLLGAGAGAVADVAVVSPVNDHAHEAWVPKAGLTGGTEEMEDSVPPTTKQEAGREEGQELEHGAVGEDAPPELLGASRGAPRAPGAPAAPSPQPPALLMQAITKKDGEMDKRREALLRVEVELAVRSLAARVATEAGEDPFAVVVQGPLPPGMVPVVGSVRPAKEEDMDRLEVELALREAVRAVVRRVGGAGAVASPDPLGGSWSFPASAAAAAA